MRENMSLKGEISSKKKYRLELFQSGTVSDVYKFMEQDVFTAWDRVAGEYSINCEDISGLAWGIKGHNYPWILSHVDFKKENKVLDVGGAYSILPVIIKERFGSEMWIVDDFGVETGDARWSRWGEREKQKAKYPDVNYVFETLGDISKSNLRKNYFDIIYSASTLEHIPHELMRSVFDHMLFLLKPGGILAHCVDVSICANTRQAREAMLGRSLRYSSGWFKFLREYFPNSSLSTNLMVRRPDEYELAMNPNIVTESPEIVFKYYPPNRRVKTYTRRGTITFIVRDESE
jgi:ubiquinone/menaquinone biosynthesis C-methylase UbiE